MLNRGMEQAIRLLLVFLFVFSANAAEAFSVNDLLALKRVADPEVSPDGKWFVFARRGGANHIIVLQNVAELARRLARGAGTLP